MTDKYDNKDIVETDALWKSMENLKNKFPTLSRRAWKT